MALTTYAENQMAEAGRIYPTDQHKRPLHDLRVSVIDRCNFRCAYCMPVTTYPDCHKFLPESEWLSFDEIKRLVHIFIRLGVSKIRLTGGEPLLRPNLPQLIRQLSGCGAGVDMALTTNGSLLPGYACALRQAGLKRLTVSLDSLDDDVFRRLNGNRARVAEVMAGIRAAERAGFTSCKINVVLQRGINDAGVLDLVRAFQGSGHILRFIEYMDVGQAHHWHLDKVVPNRETYRRINAVFPLIRLQPNYYGEVADRYAFADGGGEIGFISSITQPFCGTCTRGRLSPDGKFYTCLFAQKGTDLRTPLRRGLPDKDLYHLIRTIWQQRADRYSEERTQPALHNPEALPKLEMYQIGG